MATPSLIPCSSRTTGTPPASGCFVQGHRALIDRQAADWFGRGSFGADRRRALFAGQIKGWKHAFRWPVPLARTREDLRGIRGCNLGIWRGDLIAVNGYNEAFEGWGREDSELAVRLLNTGLRRLDLRGRALCYHLWHPPASRAGLAQNDRLLEDAIARRSRFAASAVSTSISPSHEAAVSENRQYGIILSRKERKDRRDESARGGFQPGGVSSFPLSGTRVPPKINLGGTRVRFQGIALPIPIGIPSNACALCELPS